MFNWKAALAEILKKLVLDAIQKLLSGSNVPAGVSAQTMANPNVEKAVGEVVSDFLN